MRRCFPGSLASYRCRRPTSGWNKQTRLRAAERSSAMFRHFGPEILDLDPSFVLAAWQQVWGLRVHDTDQELGHPDHRSDLLPLVPDLGDREIGRAHV